MGYYSDYINTLTTFGQIEKERKNILQIITTLRGNRNILVIGSDYTNSNAPIGIEYSDLLPIADQIQELSGDTLDVILETPGGSGEVAEDIVRLLRNKFKDISFIIPGWCKSAGTIIAMSGNDILMDELSSLGPIDAQIARNGKVFSAHAFLEGLEKIKNEAIHSLNKAYIPILQGISPGEIQHCENSLNFAKQLVSNWLKDYKFAPWETHSSTGQPVTPEEKLQRAKEVADELCNHSKWLTHGRSIKLDDLVKMRVKVTDLNSTPELKEAVRKYYTLMRMTFDFSGIYKYFETLNSQIYRAAIPRGSNNETNKNSKLDHKFVEVEVRCKKCNEKIYIQANLEENIPLKEGSIKFPSNNIIKCNKCNEIIDLSSLRKEIETKIGKKII